MRRRAAALALMITGAAVGLAAAQPAQAPVAAPAPVPATAPAYPAYLVDREPDTQSILPPPPKDGSLTDQRDFDVFMATRALAGTPRWALAALDAVDYYHGFGCVLGLTLSPVATPKTYRLLRRLGADSSVVTNRPKDAFARKRPLYGNNQPICTPDQRDGLSKSASYPSGHTTFGWAAGLVLAELVPDEATEILVRARAFGESRVVCGVHFVSDVDQGRTNGAALVAALHGDPAFRADLEAARAELAAMRAANPTPPADSAQCAAETRLAAKTPWTD